VGPASRRTDFVLAGGVIGILTVLVAPLPPMLLDFLLTTNLTLSLLILAVAMYIKRPLEFSVFPSLLLVATLYRLSLNVAATRLILLHGGEGSGAAGRVIQGFGQFVVGGNFIVGVVLFLILIVIQFVVITKGAGRIAEVAARFTLDAMPGKQMAIDADLNAGLIGEHEARSRRESIAREADFYGAMDGSSKFVRGDAIAAILITAINILGGFAIGVFQEGMPLMDALDTYTTLTVGDGLVAQLPALITSTAAGIVVTRAASESDLSRDLLGQLTSRPRPLAVAASVLGVIALFPGLPALPFLIPAAALGVMAYRLNRAPSPAAADAQTPEATASGGLESVDALLPIDPLGLEIGYGLLGLVEPGGTNGDLLERIRLLRRQFATDLGIVVPPIRVRDSGALGATQYAIKVRGSEVAKGEVFPDRLLAMRGGTGRRLHRGRREHGGRHASQRDDPSPRTITARPAGRPGAREQGARDASRGRRGARAGAAAPRHRASRAAAPARRGRLHPRSPDRARGPRRPRADDQRSLDPGGARARRAAGRGVPSSRRRRQHAARDDAVARLRARAHRAPGRAGRRRRRR
jgi:flagellar biosynthesis protein FlhA